jgi:creatinine amidohydrolase
VSDDLKTLPAPAAGWLGAPILLSEMTTESAAELIGAGGAVALVPVGSLEPHGPHLPLGTDALLSEEVCRRATAALRARGRPTIVAPGVAYGVTRYAQGFRGVLTVSEPTLVALLSEIGGGLLDDGFAHVAFVNNHLEPAHVAALDRVVAMIAGQRGPECISFPNQLGKRWGRTLTEEFKRGNCHAGRYETSLVLAARGDLVRTDLAHALPTLTISLSDAIKKSPSVTFGQIGMMQAYTGAPAEGTAAEGEDTYSRLVDMVVTEVTEHLEDAQDDTSPGPLPNL